MMEITTAILGLISAVIFAAHVVDLYRSRNVYNLMDNIKRGRRIMAGKSAAKKATSV
jgi:hypothetical protein